MKLTINGEARQLPEQATVSVMAEVLELPVSQVAVERNRAIVPRSAWGDTALAEGDVIEIVKFIGGG